MILYQQQSLSNLVFTIVKGIHGVLFCLWITLLHGKWPEKENASL